MNFWRNSEAITVLNFRVSPQMPFYELLGNFLEFVKDVQKEPPEAFKNYWRKFSVNRFLNIDRVFSRNSLKFKLLKKSMYGFLKEF